MNISENIKKLCSNINYIFDKEKNVKYTGEFKPILYKHIYSSSKNKTIRIENKGEILPIKGVVNYKCTNCYNTNEILLKRFLRFSFFCSFRFDCFLRDFNFIICPSKKWKLTPEL